MVTSNSTSGLFRRAVDDLRSGFRVSSARSSLVGVAQVRRTSQPRWFVAPTVLALAGLCDPRHRRQGPRHSHPRARACSSGPHLEAEHAGRPSLARDAGYAVGTGRCRRPGADVGRRAGRARCRPGRPARLAGRVSAVVRDGLTGAQPARRQAPDAPRVPASVLKLAAAAAVTAARLPVGPPPPTRRSSSSPAPPGSCSSPAATPCSTPGPATDVGGRAGRPSSPIPRRGRPDRPGVARERNWSRHPRSGPLVWRRPTRRPHVAADIPTDRHHRPRDDARTRHPAGHPRSAGPGRPTGRGARRVRGTAHRGTDRGHRRQGPASCRRRIERDRPSVASAPIADQMLALALQSRATTP